MIKTNLESRTSMIIDLYKEGVIMTFIRYGVKLEMEFNDDEFIQLMVLLFNSDKIVRVRGRITFSKLTDRFEQAPIRMSYIDGVLIAEVKNKTKLLYAWAIDVDKEEIIEQLIDPIFEYQSFSRNKLFVIGEGKVCIDSGTDISNNVRLIFAKDFIDASKKSGFEIIGQDKKLFTSSMDIERAKSILFKEDGCYAI